jgi:hypothetical protein
VQAKASIWKRAIAIAHRVIEEHPDGDHADAFKRRCAEQGVDASAPGSSDPRPLHARALDFARLQRRRRAR